MDNSNDASANAAIDGSGTASDYDYLTGGILAANQDPYSAASDGTLNNAVTGTGKAPSAGTITPPAGGSSATPPSWLTQLTALSTSVAPVATAATQTAAIINGKPVTSPAQSGQPMPAPGSSTVTIGGVKYSMTTIGLAIAAAVAAFIVIRKKNK